jgi:hypothetical protein
MDERDSLDEDVVVFELLTFEDVEAFCGRFRSRWPGWSYADADIWLFSIDLLAPTDDLPVLLHEARELVGELGLPSIRFHLDGRAYELDSIPGQQATQSASAAQD